jgi:NAD(P)-dependent dehydrogenase (short-subunit alcohol dehydrogenase family)
MSLLDSLLDRSVFFSFDRSGFERHARRFRREDLACDLTGRTVLVTGATSGLGRATAAALLRLGAEVHLLSRDEARGEETARALAAETGSPRARVAHVDIADLASVRRYARTAPHSVDVLVHNAGVLLDEREETADRIERTLATSVVGPFLLTSLLRPRLEASSGARVVWVSSGGMHTVRLDLGDVQWTTRPFDGVLAYAQTKRMQVVLSELFGARFSGTRVSVQAMHPGWADTPGVERSLPRFHRLMRGRLRTPEQGADTIVWLAACPRLEGRASRFWFDRAAAPTHLFPWTREAEPDRRELWELCEQLSARGRPKQPARSKAGAAAARRKKVAEAVAR